MGFTYKKATSTARENRAQALNPDALIKDKIPLAQKLPQWAVIGEGANSSTMEFECDKQTAAKLQINDMITQSLRRPNKR